MLELGRRRKLGSVLVTEVTATKSDGPSKCFSLSVPGSALSGLVLHLLLSPAMLAEESGDSPEERPGL